MCFSQFYTDIYSSRLIRILQYLTIYMIITIMIRHAIDSLLNPSLSTSEPLISTQYVTVQLQCLHGFTSSDLGCSLQSLEQQEMFGLLLLVPRLFGSLACCRNVALFGVLQKILMESCTHLCMSISVRKKHLLCVEYTLVQ